jgi:hypothetical protein
MTPPRLQSATAKAFPTPPERPGNATVGYDPQSRFKKRFSGVIYPPSSVKLRPSERRYKPYIVVLLVSYRLGTLPADNSPADLLFVI